MSSSKPKTQTKKHNNQNGAAKKAATRRAINAKQNITNQLYKKYKVDIRGRGGYTLGDFWNTVSTPFRHEAEGSGAINQAVRGAAEAIGKTVTGSSTVGKYLGNAASWFTKLMGSGSYRIRQNSVMSEQGSSQGSVPTFKPNGATTVAHREYIGDVTGSVAFANTTYLLNPGNATLFPWLSNLARNFEQYEWLGLAFEFRTTCSYSSATGNLGTIVMATDYDVVDTPYATKREMEIADFAGSAAPVSTFMHFVECSPKLNVMRQMYVQSGNTVAGYPDDPRFSVPGLFQIATQGMPSAFTVGELWVTYNVRLSKPVIPPVLSASSNLSAIHRLVTGATEGGQSVPFAVGNSTMAAVTTVVSGFAQGINITALAPGNYATCIVVTKQPGAGGFTTPGTFATQYTGAAAAYAVGLGHSGLANYTLGNPTIGGSVDSDAATTIGTFTVSNITDSVTYPMQFWDPSGNGITVVITQLSPTVLKKEKYNLQALQAKMELMAAKLDAINSKDEEDEGDYSSVTSSSSSSAAAYPQHVVAPTYYDVVKQRSQPTPR